MAATNGNGKQDEQRRSRGDHRVLPVSRWLSAGAVTLGMGAAMIASAGFAHAEPASDGSSSSTSNPGSGDTGASGGTGSPSTSAGTSTTTSATAPTGTTPSGGAGGETEGEGTSNQGSTSSDTGTHSLSSGDATGGSRTPPAPRTRRARCLGPADRPGRVHGGSQRREPVR